MSFGIDSDFNDVAFDSSASRSTSSYYQPSRVAHVVNYQSSAGAGFNDLPPEMKLELMRNATDAALYRMCNEQWDALGLCETDRVLRDRFARINTNIARLLERSQDPLAILLKNAKTEDERRAILNAIVDYQAMGTGDDVLDINKCLNTTYDNQNLFTLRLHELSSGVFPVKIPAILQYFDIVSITINAWTVSPRGVTSEFLDKILAPKVRASHLREVDLDYHMNLAWPLEFFSKFGSSLKSVTISDRSVTARKVPRKFFVYCPQLTTLSLTMPLDRISKAISLLTQLQSLTINCKPLFDDDRDLGRLSKLPVGINDDLQWLNLLRITTPFTFERNTFPRRLHGITLSNVKLANELPEWLGEITTLRFFHMNNVNISAMPKSVLMLPNLLKFTVNDEAEMIRIFDGNQEELEKFRQRLHDNNDRRYRNLNK